MPGRGHGLPCRGCWHHERCTPDSCRLPATLKSAESGHFQTSNSSPFALACPGRNLDRDGGLTDRMLLGGQAILGDVQADPSFSFLPPRLGCKRNTRTRR
jgi:hypothetical protein